MEDKRKTIDKDLGYLRQKSIDVDFHNDNYKEWIKELQEYCSKMVLFALAPIQIGIPKRMIYFKNTTEDMSKNADSDYDENQILINPRIISMKGHTKYLERCGSCLDFVGEVDRPYMVEVEYFDINGNKHQEIFVGLKATIFCHEYDHLNGILHIDRADNVTRKTYKETKEYRLRHPYRILSQSDEYIDKLQLKDMDENIR